MMKHRNNRFFITLMVMWCVGIAAHAASHWTCDGHAYQYDMTSYVQLTDGGFPLQDYSDYEIAAFVGDECRGVAQIVNASKPYGLIRIRSNEAQGEQVTFRVFKFSTMEEINIYDVAIEFTSQGIEGLPSAPLSLELTHKKLLGDVNEDGIVDVADVVALIGYVLGNNLQTFNSDLADMNEDKLVDVQDVVALIEKVLGNK